MVVLPPATGAIKPVVSPTVAVPGVLLFQVPPDAASVNVTLDPPTHKAVLAFIGPGAAFTVAIVVAVQPSDVNVKVIVGVVPAVRPVNTPDELIEPLAVLLLLQVPAPVTSDRVMFAPPTQTDTFPDIAAGAGNILIVAVPVIAKVGELTLTE